MEELTLILTENELDFKTFKLCNLTGSQIVSFDVEIDKETALINYETQEKFRNKGYASKGLNLLKDVLFNDDNILFLELINLSGDYSRKVAENAGFFSRSGNLDYYVLLNPLAEQILNDRLNFLDVSSVKFKKTHQLLEKVKKLRQVEFFSKQKMQAKLDELLQQREVVDSVDYKEYIESEINHLQKVLIDSQDIKKL